MRPELQDEVDAVVIGWGYGDDSSFVARHMQAGTRDPAAFLTIPAAIDWQAANGWTDVRDGCHELARTARAHLGELTGLRPIAPDSRRFFVQMVAATLPECDTDELERRLRDEHRIEVPVRRWNDQPLIRVSLQAYNDERDLDRLLDALRVLLR